MKVIKKSGKIEELDITKIETSIRNAAADNSFELNESDVNVIIEDVIHKIDFLRKDGSCTSSYEIKAVIVEKFVQDGFGKIIDSYIGYNKNE